jgi:hypothetical protein
VISNIFSVTVSSSDIAAEARYLKEHRGRLEARMKFLEDQNTLLEMQMHRLKTDQVLFYNALCPQIK